MSEFVKISTEALDRLKAAAAPVTSLSQSIHVIISGLASHLRDFADAIGGGEAEPADVSEQINALADALDANRAELSAAAILGTAAEGIIPPTGVSDTLPGNDTVDTGAGNDTVSLNDTVDAGAGSDSLPGVEDPNTPVTGDGSDEVDNTPTA